MQKRILSFILVLILMPSLLFSSTIISYSKDVTELTNIDVIINPKKYKNLINKDNRKIAYPALASVNGSDYVNIQINTRGESSFRSALDTGYNRFPFKVSFEPFSIFSETGNSFLKLNNSFSLYTMVAEHIALELFEFMDYPISKHFPIVLSFNDVYFGLYLGIEEINESFLFHHFGENALSNGNLYKACEDENPDYFSSYYFGSLDFVCGNQNHNTINSLFESIWYNDYERFFDMDNVIKFFACLASIGGVDTFLELNHNYYLYENNGKITFIPWDLSFAFNCFSMKQSVFPDKKNDTTSHFFNLIMEKPENREKYCRYIEYIRKNFLTPKNIDPIIEEFISLVDEYYLKDRSLGYHQNLFFDLIYNSDVLVYGNIFLAVNEVYRQLEEQVNGDADYFYVPKHLKKDIFSIIPKQSIYSSDGETLEHEICNNYYQAFWGKHLSNGGKVSILIVSLFILFSIVFYLSYRIPKGRKRK